VCSILSSAYYYYQSSLSFNKLFSQMAFPLKQDRTLEERLCIIEVEKHPSEKRTDVAKRPGLPPSTLNTIIDDDEDAHETAPSFTEALRVFESMSVHVCSRHHQKR
jgi:hypothetical protein